MDTSFSRWHWKYRVLKVEIVKCSCRSHNDQRAGCFLNYSVCIVPFVVTTFNICNSTISVGCDLFLILVLSAYWLSGWHE